MIVVTLSNDEILAGVVVAAQRKMASDRRRANGNSSRRQEHYTEQRTWDQEIEAALAEMAVSRWRNRYWWGSSFNGKDAGTDAGDAQVRWTEHENGHLILYVEDAEEKPYVLVTGRSPHKTIVGWGYGHELRKDDFWKHENVKCPSWWIPPRALRQISLKEALT